MSSPLDHAWGLSPGADRVWAEVCGFSPSKAGKRLFVVLQAVIDDSHRRGGVFVLAGYIASAEAWARFAKEWEQMLPRHGTLNKRNRWHFKMSEMAQNPDRMSRVPGFFRIIEDHMYAAISCKIDVGDLIRARNRIWVPNVKLDWGVFKSPYKVAFWCLVDKFHGHLDELAEVFSLTEKKADFYLDDYTEKAAILETWSSYQASIPDEARDLFGATPVFRSDEDFLPLQAADFWAWWIGKWYEEDEERAVEKIRRCDFGAWQGIRRNYLKIIIRYNEEHLVKVMKHWLRSRIGPDHVIYDVTSS